MNSHKELREPELRHFIAAMILLALLLLWGYSSVYADGAPPTNYGKISSEMGDSLINYFDTMAVVDTIQAIVAGVSGLGDPGGNGVVVRTAINTTTNRTITGSTHSISVTNGDGVSGNPSITLARTATLADAALSANHTAFATTGVIMEGATADGFEVLITPTDPTADRTITLPNSSGTVALTTDQAPDVDTTGTDIAAALNAHDALFDNFSELSGTVGDAQIADGAVDGGTGGEIADNSITAADIAADAVGTSELSDGLNLATDGDIVTIDGTNFGYLTGTEASLITGVTAGSGLTGGGGAGDVPLNIGAGTGISVAADAISATLGTEVDTTEIDTAQFNQYVEDHGVTIDETSSLFIKDDIRSTGQLLLFGRPYQFDSVGTVFARNADSVCKIFRDTTAGALDSQFIHPTIWSSPDYIGARSGEEMYGYDSTGATVTTITADTGCPMAPKIALFSGYPAGNENYETSFCRWTWDGINWTLPFAFDVSNDTVYCSDPIIELTDLGFEADHMADPFIFTDRNAIYNHFFICDYGSTFDSVIVWRQWSHNGISWHPDSLEKITTETTYKIVSPSVVTDTNGYRMYVCEQNGAYYDVGYYFKADSLEGGEDEWPNSPKWCILEGPTWLDTASNYPWHCEIDRFGNTYFGTFIFAANGDRDSLYFGTSMDGDTFHIWPNPILGPGEGTTDWDKSTIYKASQELTFSEKTGLRLNLWYSANGEGGWWTGKTQVRFDAPKKFSATIFDPDAIQATSDALPIMDLSSNMYPHGITITELGIATNAASSFDAAFEDWDDPADGSPAAITTVSTSTSTEASTEVRKQVDQGQWIFLDLDTDALNWLHIWGTYYVND